MLKHFCKKVVLFGMVLSLGLTSSSKVAKADIFDSPFFEPVLGCVGLGTVGYFVVAPSGSELVYGAIGCGAGVLVGILINSHYSSKYGKVYQKDITDLRVINKQYELQQALRNEKGEDDNVAIRIKEYIPPQKTPQGGVTEGYFVEKLVPAGEPIRQGGD